MTTKDKLERIFLISWATSPLLIFIRMLIIKIPISGIEKNFNLNLGLLAIISLLGLYLFFSNLKTLYKKYSQQIILWIILIFTIFTANIISIFYSVDKMLSISMLISLTTSYVLGTTTIIWFILLYKNLTTNNRLKTQSAIRAIKTFIYSLNILTIVEAILSATQFYVVYNFKKSYHTIPLLVKRIVNNGYFLNEYPHQYLNYKLNILRPPGLLGDNNTNAMLLFILFIILSMLYITFLIVNLQDKKLIFMTKLSLIIIPLLYLLSLSRSAILGGGVVILLITCLFGIPILISNKRLLKIVIKTYTIILMILFILAISSTFIKIKNKSLFNLTTQYIIDILNVKKNASAKVHFKLANTAIKLSKENNLKPWGLGTFPKVYLIKINPNSYNGASAHSMYATTLMEQGVIGLSLYILVILIIWYIFISSVIKLTKNLKQISKKQGIKLSTDVKYMTILNALRTGLNSALPILSISTIFYYGFWDQSTWWWGVYCTPKKDRA